TYFYTLSLHDALPILLGRNEERAQKRVSEIEAIGGEDFYILADVLSEEQIRQARNQIISKWGTIDGLVNAAGGNIAGATIQPDQDLFTPQIEDTKKAVDLNLFGTVIPTHIFGQVIAEKGKGSIVNISSLAAQQAITR